MERRQVAHHSSPGPRIQAMEINSLVKRKRRRALEIRKELTGKLELTEKLEEMRTMQKTEQSILECQLSSWGGEPVSPDTGEFGESAAHQLRVKQQAGSSRPKKSPQLL